MKSLKNKSLVHVLPWLMAIVGLPLWLSSCKCELKDGRLIKELEGKRFVLDTQAVSKGELPSPFYFLQNGLAITFYPEKTVLLELTLPADSRVMKVLAKNAVPMQWRNESTPDSPFTIHLLGHYSVEEKNIKIYAPFSPDKNNSSMDNGFDISSFGFCLEAHYQKDPKMLTGSFKTGALSMSAVMRYEEPNELAHTSWGGAEKNGSIQMSLAFISNKSIFFRFHNKESVEPEPPLIIIPVSYSWSRDKGEISSGSFMGGGYSKVINFPWPAGTKEVTIKDGGIEVRLVKEDNPATVWVEKPIPGKTPRVFMLRQKGEVDLFYHLYHFTLEQINSKDNSDFSKCLVPIEGTYKQNGNKLTLSMEDGKTLQLTVDNKKGVARIDGSTFIRL